MRVLLVRILLAVASACIHAAASSLTSAVFGFNSGVKKQIEKTFKIEDDYLKLPEKLDDLPVRFDSVRLFTMKKEFDVPEGQVELNPAIKVAIETKTTMLLGVWCTNDTTEELTALKFAIDRYGPELADLVIGISVGSEDLLRLDRGQNDGQTPEQILEHISKVREAIKGTALADTKIGHVEPVGNFLNHTEVLEPLDFVGANIYPFYTRGGQQNMSGIFDEALEKIQVAAKGKPVWITETGWPASGTIVEENQPSAENARRYWQEIGCNRLFKNPETNVWWYNLRDSNPDIKNHFAISKDLTTETFFSLACDSSEEVEEQQSSSVSPVSQTPQTPRRATGAHVNCGNTSTLVTATPTLTESCGGTLASSKFDKKVVTSDGTTTTIWVIETVTLTTLTTTVRETFRDTDTIILTHTLRETLHDTIIKTQTVRETVTAYAGVPGCWAPKRKRDEL